MGRLFWIALGAAAGVYAVRKITQTAHAYSPQGVAEGLSGSLSNFGEAFRDFADAVREGAAEREAELRAALAGDVIVDPTSADPAADPLHQPATPEA